MARIKIGNLQKDVKLGKDEMQALLGGYADLDGPRQRWGGQRRGAMASMAMANRWCKYVIGDSS